jgi:hypothetical protein
MEAVKQWSEVARINGIPQSQLTGMEKAFSHVESAKALKMLK